MAKKVIGEGENQPQRRRSQPKKKKEVRVDEAIMEPGDYEVTSQHTFEVKLYLKPKDNRWVIMTGSGADIVEHTVVVRLWSYDEMIGLRKTATTYDAAKRIHMVDQDFLNRLKIQKLVISWTLEEINPRLKLHRQQGSLTDESWGNFKKVQPNILQYIINKINDVLEYNA